VLLPSPPLPSQLPPNLLLQNLLQNPQPNLL
jgi:hypothetical protein